MASQTALESSGLNELRRRVRAWMGLNKKSQTDLAVQCGIDGADLTRFLSGARGLPAFALANLSLSLGIDPAQLLLLWDSSQCRRELEKLEARDGESAESLKATGWKAAQSTYESLLRALPATDATSAVPGKLGTLVDWPDAFFPLVCLVGDRRENDPPYSPADLLAASASIGDLFYFPRLRLPADTEIRSDKTCIAARPDSLRALLEGKNLLIVGSPAANLAARAVNSGACFSFHATPKAMAQAAHLQEILEPIRHYPDQLERFVGTRGGSREPVADENAGAKTSAEEEIVRDRNHMIYGFARSGILDPIRYRGLRGEKTSAHKDYGVVTLCRHPWSDDRVAIMVAGLHGPATAAGVKLLAQPRAFADRPYGGVFSVHVAIEVSWEERYRHLNPQWDTHSYTPAEYAAEVDKFAAGATRGEEFGFWNPDYVRTLLRLVTPGASA